jgi:hypothetical protein
LNTISAYENPDKPEKNYALKQVWTLTDDKKGMSVVLTSPAYTIKLYYDKQ